MRSRLVWLFLFVWVCHGSLLRYFSFEDDNLSFYSSSCGDMTPANYSGSLSYVSMGNSRALYLNTNSEFLNGGTPLVDINDLALTPSAFDFSITFWVSVQSQLGPTSYFFSLMNGGLRARFNSNRFSLNLESSSTSILAEFNIPQPSANNFISIVFDRQAGRLVLYRDGMTVYSTSLPSNFVVLGSNIVQDVYLNCNRTRGDSCTRYFLDELAFWDEALSPSAIQTLMNSPLRLPSLMIPNYVSIDGVKAYSIAPKLEYPIPDVVPSWTVVNGSCNSATILDDGNGTFSFSFQQLGVTALRLKYLTSTSFGVPLCIYRDITFDVTGILPQIPETSLLRNDTIRVRAGEATTIDSYIFAFPTPIVTWQQLQLLEQGINGSSNATEIEFVFVTMASGLSLSLNFTEEDNGTTWRVLTRNALGPGEDIFFTLLVEQSDVTKSDRDSESGSDKDAGNGSLGAIVGGAVGGAVLLALLLCCVFCVCLVLVIIVVILVAVVLLLLIFVIVALCAALLFVVSFGSAWLVRLKKREKSYDLAAFDGYEGEVISDGLEREFRELAYSDLTFEHKIGEGAYGRVYLGYWREMTIVAIKELNITADEKAKRAFINEANIMAHLGNHPHVVHFIGAVTTEDKYYMISEFAPNGSLLDLLKRNPSGLADEVKLKMAQQAASGIAHLHAEGVVHRDIAARNFLVGRDFQIMVTDFGMSRILQPESSEVSGQRTTSDVGPVRWMAPESLQYHEYSPASDVYMFAGFLHELYTGCVPFSETDIADVIVRVTEGKHPVVTVEGIVGDVMEKCWTFVAKKRPDMKEVLKMLGGNGSESTSRGAGTVEWREEDSQYISGLFNTSKTKI